MESREKTLWEVTAQRRSISAWNMDEERREKKKEEEMDGGPTINDKIRKEKNMRDKICKIFLKPQTN